MKSKEWMFWCDSSLTPCNRLSVNIDTVVAASEIPDEADREIANARADIKNPMLGAKAMNGEFFSCIFARKSKRFGLQRAVVVGAQMRWRQQGVAPPTHDPLQRRHDAIGRLSRGTGQLPPHGSSLH